MIRGNITRISSSSSSSSSERGGNGSPPHTKPKLTELTTSALPTRLGSPIKGNVTKSLDTPDDFLLDFLEKSGHSFSFPPMKLIFNAPFDLETSFSENEMFIAEYREEFKKDCGESLLIDGSHFIHAQALIGERSDYDRLKRRVNCVTDTLKKHHDCDIHNRKCLLLEERAAFFVFLYLKGYFVNLVYKSTQITLPSSHSSHEEVEETSILDEEGERKESLEYKNLSIVRTQTLPDFENANESDNLCLPFLPTLSIQGNHYYFLHDIERVFQCREDYALFKLVQWAEHVDAFVDLQPQSTLMTLEHEVHTDAGCLAIAFNELDKYKSVHSAPTEDEFVNIQKQLNIQNMGKTVEEITEPRIEHPIDTSSINLWADKPVHLDEEIKVDNVMETDDFLQRHGRKRKGVHGLDSTLAEYITKLKASQVLVYHNKYSVDGEFYVMCLKALSAYLGGWSIPHNFQKVILVERAFAISAFGYAPGFPACRASFALMYATYAHMTEVTDPALLEPLERRQYLRIQRHIVTPDNIKVEEIKEE